MVGPERPCADCKILLLADPEERETFFMTANAMVAKLAPESISQRRKGVLSIRQGFEGKLAKGHEGIRAAGRCALRRLVERDCEYAVPPPGENT